MIQRIQTVYLLASAICLSVVLFGRSVLIYFIGSTIQTYQMTIYGITDQEKTSYQSSLNLPFYILSVLTIGLVLFAIFSFKNLNRQGMITRIAALLYGIQIIGIVIVYFMHDIKIDGMPANAMIGSGFYILAIGFPFLFLANNGIKRDKKLLDSLNRLR